MMKALVNLAYQQTIWTDQQKPHIKEPTDALIRIKMITFSQQDYRLNDDVSNQKQQLIMGHEGIGTIESLGSAVQTFKLGDMVLIHGITVCGCCDLCRQSDGKICQRYGFWHGVSGPGTHAEYCLVPYADLNLTIIPSELNPTLALLSCDTLITIYSLVYQPLQHNQAIKHLAIVGDGAIALATVLLITTWLPSLVVDLYVKHPEKVQPMQPLVRKIINIKESIPPQHYDVVVEAVGNEKKQTLPLCQRLLGYNGLLLVLGVFEQIKLNGYDFLYKNNTLKHGIVDFVKIDQLLHLLIKQPINYRLLVNPVPYYPHQIEQAYAANRINKYSKNICVINE